MPRFAFGKRKSAADVQNDTPAPSFRVLDRSEVVDGNGKSFDGGAHLAIKTQTLPRTTVSDLSYEDNLFANFKPTANRYVRPLLHSSHLLNREAVAWWPCQFPLRGSLNLISYPGNSCLRADLIAGDPKWTAEWVPLLTLALAAVDLPRRSRPILPPDTATLPLHHLLRT